MRYSNISGTFSISISKSIGLLGRLCVYAYFFTYYCGAALGFQGLAIYCIYGMIVLSIIYWLVEIRKIYRADLWYIGLTILALISSAYSIDPNTSLESTNVIFQNFLKIWAIGTLFGTWNNVKKLLYFFSLSLCIFFASLFFTGQLYSSQRLGNILIGNANALSLYLIICAFCSVAAFIDSKRAITKILFATILVIDLYLCALTESRKSIMIIIAFIYIYILMAKRERRGTILKATIIVIAILLVLYVVITSVDSIYNSIGVRFITMLNSLSSGSGYGDDEIRVDLISYGLRMFLSRPVFGYGNDTCKILNQYSFSKQFYSHNNYVELLVNLGLVGFLYYYIFIIRTIKNLFGVDEMTKLRNVLVSIILCCLLLDISIVSYNQLVYVPMFIYISSRLAQPHITGGYLKNE